MKKSFLKSITIGLAAAVLLIGCASNDAHNTHKKSSGKYAKELKKKRMEKAANKEEVKSTEFCFKNNRSIHYKESERCK